MCPGLKLQKAGFRCSFCYCKSFVLPIQMLAISFIIKSSTFSAFMEERISHSMLLHPSLPSSREQPTSITAHNTHQNCVCVVPPEDGQVMPETCRGFKTRIKVKVTLKCVSSWLCL
jgi:hypothetical protein